MKGQLKVIKDQAYYYFAQKNWGVGREYGPYKDSHMEEHKNKPWKHWWLLIRLNWHYRVLRRNTWLLPELYAGEQKLPYLEGAESSISQRRKATAVVRELLQYDVVSFDIFDTLVLRPFAKPADLFMIVGKRLKKVEFCRIRINAEKRAREEALRKTGNSEITISDIYEIIENRTGIPKELGIQTELQAELDYCFANPYMKRIYRMLKEQKKVIIITSDMYLPQHLIRQILTNCGYTGYDKLYVSCDHGCSKRTGELYQIIKNDFPGRKLIHIGDNQISDIQSAEEQGIKTFYYRNCHEIGNQFRADGMSEFVTSSYSGIVNTHLHSGEEIYSPYYEYGFIYGGLYILGFCNWIHRYVKREGIDKVLFLSRDGDIYYRVFNMLYTDVSNEYFLWSRIANTKYTCLKNREDFLNRVVFYRSLSPFAISIEALLNSLHLEVLIQYVPDFGLAINDLVVPENVDKIDNLFIKHWEDVCSAFEQEKRYIREYIDRKVAGVRKVAIIDVGWMGSGPMGLKYLIEEELGYDCRVYCLQAAARPPLPTDIAPELMDGTVEPYMFSQMLNRNLYETHHGTNHGLNNIFFEMFTQADYPSYSGIMENGDYSFDFPEVENYAGIREIHRGIIDFCEEYIRFFHKDSFALQISGYDAYCPYRMIIRNLDFIKNQFAEFTFARNISGDMKNQRIETVKELLEQAGV